MEALKLRHQGFQTTEIARQLGCTYNTAVARIKRAIAATWHEDVSDVVQIELARLDEMFRLVWEDMHADHVKVDHGQVIYSKGEDGEWIRDADGRPIPVIDKQALHTAVTSAVKIQHQRAQYLGAYAPVRHSVTIITDEEIQAELKAIRARLAAKGVNLDDYIDAKAVEQPALKA